MAARNFIRALPVVASLGLALAIVAMLRSPHQPNAAPQDAMDRILQGEHRAPENRRRDAARHPRETLQFFEVNDAMTVVEVWPYSGWYTEILAPLLRDHGRLYAAGFALGSAHIAPYQVRLQQDFLAKLAKRPDIYDKVVVTELEAPEFTAIAPNNAADRVLTFLNIHNWIAEGRAEETFQAFFDALKPGGLLGVVEHRAQELPSPQALSAKGYVPESLVITLATQAGFALLDRSEINANPRDTKDHPKGVWSLPPSLAEGAVNREKYLAIGESDRMTLKFQKPAKP